MLFHCSLIMVVRDMVVEWINGCKIRCSRDGGDQEIGKPANLS